MDNREMAKVLAEMQGWELRREPFVDEWYDSKGFWCGMVPNIEAPPEDGAYDPATNIAQAIEAIEAWRDKTGRHWDISSPVFGGDDKFCCAIYHLVDGEDWARADTPAQAITEALVKAVSDG